MAVRPVIRDYSDTNFERGPKKDGKRGLRFAVLGVCAFIFLIGGGLLLARSPWFYVHEYHISGLEFVSEDAVRATIDSVLDGYRYRFFPMRHMMFLEPQAVQAALTEQFAFSEVTAEKRSGALYVSVHERPTGVYVTDGKTAFFTDLQGIVVREATDEERAMVGNSNAPLPFLLLSIESTLDAKPGDRLFDADVLDNYEHLKLRFEVETGLPVHQYVLPRAGSTWMKAKLADGREIYIDMTRDIEIQIQKLLTLIKTKGKALDTVTYIDLRFSDRVYYK